MGRRNKKQKRLNKSSDRSEVKRSEKQGEGYSDIVKENLSFEAYYKAQGIVPEEEWNNFMSTLREGLPTAFRITGYRGQAKAIRKIIQSQYFQDLLKVRVEEEELCEPICLPWYPDSLAWQLKLSRVIIRKSEELTKLHNFLVSETESGNISRQETVSMIPPLLLDVQSHHKVLDMCAAPGSKTAQVIEMFHKEEGKIPEGVVIANDVDNKRCYMLVHQAKRLNSPCFIITNHDAANMPDIFVEKDEQLVPIKYDRILCDVPCSGDGTIRKNIDVWKKWNAANGNNLNGLQFRIVKRGLELLATGGRLVYSTCSLNPMENEAVIATVLQQAKGSVEIVDVSSVLPGLKTSPGLSTWTVANRDLEIFTKFEDVPEKYRTQIRPQLFPPNPEIAEQLNLHRCLRILPHHQDTGGFFVAVLELKDKLPWTIPETYIKGAGDESKGSNKGEPPRKKRRLWGYKEDPYVFFKENEEIWTNIRDFYSFTSDFPYTQLLTRCVDGRKRNLYFVSSIAKDVVKANSNRIKIINTGVRVLSRTDNKDARCSFRLVQDGISTLLPFTNGRKLNIPLEDLVLILSEDFPVNNNFSPYIKEQMSVGDSGCVILIYTANKDTKEEFQIELCGWKGKNSLRCYVPKNERVHYLRICGSDVSQFEKKEKKFKSKLLNQGQSMTSSTDGHERIEKQSDNEEILRKNSDGDSCDNSNINTSENTEDKIQLKKDDSFKIIECNETGESR